MRNGEIRAQSRNQFAIGEDGAFRFGKLVKEYEKYFLSLPQEKNDQIVIFGGKKISENSQKIKQNFYILIIFLNFLNFYNKNCV